MYPVGFKLMTCPLHLFLCDEEMQFELELIEKLKQN